jgi:hypothetical protein
VQFRKPKLSREKPQTPAQKTKKAFTPKNDSSDCPNFYGYLANRPKDTPIPQECLFCLKVTDCMYGRIKN